MRSLPSAESSDRYPNFDPHLIMYFRRHGGSAFVHLSLLTTLRIISVVDRAFQLDSADNVIPLLVCHFSLSLIHPSVVPYLFTSFGISDLASSLALTQYLTCTTFHAAFHGKVSLRALRFCGMLCNYPTMVLIRLMPELRSLATYVKS